MIRHCVLVKFRASVQEDERRSIFDQLAALRTTVPGMLSFAAGPNVSPEGLGQGYGHGFVADFRDAASRDAYLADEDHARAGARLVGALEGGLAGLLVFDIDLLTTEPTKAEALRGAFRTGQIVGDSFAAQNKFDWCSLTAPGRS